MSGTPPNPDHPHRCCAPVQEWQSQATISKRASGTRGRRCTRLGRDLVAGKLFCYQHADLWREHERILARIREIPDRDIVDS